MFNISDISLGLLRRITTVMDKEDLSADARADIDRAKKLLDFLDEFYVKEAQKRREYWEFLEGYRKDSTLEEESHA